MTTLAEPRPQYLDSLSGVSIAYHRIPGKSPGVVFLGGFMSDMTGTKALALDRWACAHGRAFVRFDYRGHGDSSGTFTEGTIGLWRDDALAVLDRLTEGPQVLVGSSMGGWIATLAALARPERIAALVMIAPALDFTGDLMWDRFPEEVKGLLRREGVYRQPSTYSTEPYAVTMRLIEEGRRHFLLGRPIGFSGPVRILHGMADPDVPWQRSLTFAEWLDSADVRLVFLKDGDPRLSRPGDLALLTATLDELVSSLTLSP